MGGSRQTSASYIQKTKGSCLQKEKPKPGWDQATHRPRKVRRQQWQPGRPRPSGRQTPNAATNQLPFRDASPRPAGARWWPTRHRAAKSVPSPAPWAILATHASIQTLDLQSSRPGHLSCPQSTVAIASRESPCLLPRGAGGGGGHLPGAEQVGLTGTRRRRKRRRKGRSVKTLGSSHSHSLGRLSARNERLRRGQKYIATRADSWVDASFSPAPQTSGFLF